MAPNDWLADMDGWAHLGTTKCQMCWSFAMFEPYHQMPGGLHDNNSLNEPTLERHWGMSECLQIALTQIYGYFMDISYGYLIFHELSRHSRCLLLYSSLHRRLWRLFWSTLRRDSDAASHGSLPTHEIMGFLRNLCPGFLGMRWWDDEMGLMGWLLLAVGATSINELVVLIKSRASISNQHVRS